MLNVLITGSNGQLGSSIKEISSKYNYSFIFASKNELDVLKMDDVQLFIDTHNIKYIINCSGYTNVDKAEEERELADDVNHKAIIVLSKISKLNSISLIHISSDYVFDGKNYKPYEETDTTNACSIYGQTKLDGEKAMEEFNLSNSIIIRTSWLYSSYANNFLKTMIKLGNENDNLNIIYDQIGTPTYALDLAKTILDILPKIDNTSTEIYHYSNEGVASWYDFAKAIMEIQNIDCLINPIQSFEYKTIANRPYYSVLNKSKIKKDFEIEIPYWKDSLVNCLKQIDKVA